MSTPTTLSQIKANILTVWERAKNGQTKFLPGDLATVKVDERHGVLTKTYKGGQSSNKIAAKQGQTGTIVAVTCSADGLLRGFNDRGFEGKPLCYRRDFTKYYVQFEDKSIFGIHSHLLDKTV
jgi:hypothetical protein